MFLYVKHLNFTAQFYKVKCKNVMTRSPYQVQSNAKGWLGIRSRFTKYLKPFRTNENGHLILCRAFEKECNFVVYLFIYVLFSFLFQTFREKRAKWSGPIITLER